MLQITELTKTNFFLCSALLVLSGSAYAGMPLKAAAVTSDVIVVAKTKGFVSSSSKLSFDLDVQQVLKGSGIPFTLHVSHNWVQRSIPRLGASASSFEEIHGIWCLKKNGDGWDVLAVNGADGFISSLYWAAPTSIPVNYTPFLGGISSNASVQDSLTVNVAAGFENSTKQNVTQMLNAFDSLDTDAARAVFARLISLPGPFRIAAIADGLKKGGAAAIASLSQYQAAIAVDPDRSVISYALRDSFRDSSPSSVQELVAFAEKLKQTSELRPAAIQAITAIHTKEALPFIASLLQSTDTNERMRGVFGLSSFANGCPMQTSANVVSMDFLQFKNPSTYRTLDTIGHFAFRRGPTSQEAELVTFWFDWWNKNSASLKI